VPRVLSASVVDILRGVKSVDGSEYVFPQRAKHGIYQTWDRIRKAAGLPGLRIHDLRHNLASGGVNGSRLRRTARGQCHC
jgi:integrase